MADVTFPPSFCLHESGHSANITPDGSIFYEDTIYPAEDRSDPWMVEVVRADNRAALISALERLDRKEHS